MPLAPIEDDSSARRIMRVMAAILVVLLVLALFPYTPHPASDIKYLIIACGVLLLSAVRMLDAWVDKGLGRPPTLLFYILVAFLAINVGASLTSSHVGHSLYASGRLACLFLLFMLVAYAFRSPKQVWRFLAVVCVSVSVSSVYGLFQKGGLDPFPWAMRNVEEYWAIPATFGNPNYAAHTLLLAIILAAGLALRKGTWWCAVPGFVIGVHFFLTHIRSGRVALLAACVTVLVAVVVGRLISDSLRAAVVTCIGVAVIGVIGVGAALGIVAMRTGAYMPLDTSLLARYNSNYGAARMVADRPLIGYGPGNYALENAPYWTPYEQRFFAVSRTMNLNVHNDFLETAVESGLPALTLYLAFFTCAVVWSLTMAFGASEPDRRRLGYTLAACFCAFAVDGLFGFNVRVPVSGALVFMLAGLLEGVVRGTGPEAAPKSTPRLLVAHTPILALALVLAAVEIRTFEGQFLFQRAKGATAWGESEAAHQILAKAEDFLPSNWQIPYTMGTIDLHQDRLEDAIERFERSLRLNPNNVKPLVALGNVHLRIHDESREFSAGHLEEAEAFQHRALALCPQLPEGHEGLGNIWALRAIERGRTSADSEASKAWREANFHFLEALRHTRHGAKDEGRGRLQKKMAHALMELGDKDRAERALRAATRSLPTDPETWRLFYQFAVDHDRYAVLTKSLNSALDRLKRAKTLDDDTLIDLSSFLAQVYRRDLGRIRAAENTIRKSLELAPHRLDLWGMYAEQLAYGQDRTRVLSSLETMARSMASEGKAFPEALDALLAAFSGEPAARVEAVEGLLIACRKRAPTVDSEVLLREYGWTVEFFLPELAHPGFSQKQRATIQRDLALVSLLCERWDLAERLLDEAMPGLPSDLRVAASLQRAEALSQLGRHDDALDMAREALRLAPRSLQTRVVLARKLAAAGKKAEARLEYTFLIASTSLEPDVRARLHEEYNALTAPDATPGEENADRD